MKYLFIRILEACNAGCFMCGYANSRDRYRFTVDDLAEILPQAQALGISVIRYTGGEPLLHQQIAELVGMPSDAGMAVSIISNGKALPKRLPALAAAGLRQVIVSLDGASGRTHDLYRRLPGCFDNAVEGLRLARASGLLTRVNTVVGPHNYREIPALQRLLSDLGIEQWELSALKTSDPVTYPDEQDVLAVGAEVYGASDLLVPLGKRWYGDTPAEQRRFFDEGLPPRASGRTCHLVDDVYYLDGRNGALFTCSCISHRREAPEYGAPVRGPDGRLRLFSPAFAEQRDYFRAEGPRVCTGCSTTAAGYSDDVERLGSMTADWAL